MDEIILELDGLRKTFGSVDALDGISLRVRKGEFITFLGPSGCGKTTMLRCIAGLEEPDSGRVLIAGEDVTGWEPNKRPVNTVFQSYALFPHRNVFHNVAYGLKLRGVSKGEIQKRVHEMLALVQLSGFEKRMPSQLSGGQRQRVAIARALINRPSVLLLDEPLGALDLQLRRQMQTELKRLQKQLGITFLYITHDQEEAINMSDRIAVMQNGVIEQEGSPAEIYDRPKTSFVAGFVGTANLIDGEIVKAFIETAVVRIGRTRMEICGAPVFAEGDRVRFMVRSENLLLFAEPREDCLPARVTEYGYAGGMLRILLETEDGILLTASRQGIGVSLSAGQAVWAGWAPQNAVAVDLPSVEDRPEE